MKSVSKLVSAFEYFMSISEALPKSQRQEAYRIFVEEQLDDLINFCKENGCISPECADFLHFDMFLYEVNERGHYLNYYEVDYDKQVIFLNKIFDHEIEEYAKNYKEE